MLEYILLDLSTWMDCYNLIYYSYNIVTLFAFFFLLLFSLTNQNCLFDRCVVRFEQNVIGEAIINILMVVKLTTVTSQRKVDDDTGWQGTA